MAKSPEDARERVASAEPYVLHPTDRAIIVGVNRYPRLENLKGAEADAKAFEAWLKSPDGGGLRHDAVNTILSSKFPEPKHPADAEPLVSTVDRAFTRLVDEGKKLGAGGKLGRRLYIFLAGHGIAKGYEDASLLTAEATYDDSGFHIPGRDYADWFCVAAFFEEVILIMDCCKDSVPNKLLRQVPWGPVEGQGAQVRSSFAFATRWSRKARERYFEEFGEVRGIFSVALLEGLWGEAHESGSVSITTASLERYVKYRLPTLCRPGQFQKAKFVYDVTDDVAFTSEARERLVRVIIHSNTWPPIEVLDSERRPMVGKTYRDGTWTADLPVGLYVIEETDGRYRTATFEVTRGESFYVDPWD